MSESKGQFEAKVELAFYAFFRCHWKEGLSSCDANRVAIEEYCDDNLLPCDKAESLEIALLAIGKSLARSATTEPPVPPTPIAPEPVATTEEEKLRAILHEHRGDPRGAADAARAMLKAKDARNKAEQTTLPVDITAETLRKMPAERMRKLQGRYGTASLNDRLQGRN